MRIALVCPYDWTRSGGVQSHVAQLATHLSERHRVVVFAPHRRGVAPAVSAPAVVDVGRPLPVPYNQSVAPVAVSPTAAGRVLRRVARFSPDVTHVHEPLSPLVSAAVAAFGRRPLVATFHSWSHHDRLYRLVAPFGRHVAKRLDVRVAVSPTAQVYAAEALGVPIGGFKVVPNGIDVARFDAEPIHALRDPARPLLLFVGRLEPRKGLDVLVRAFLRVRAAWSTVRLCVVGEGAQRERCQQMIPSSIRHDALFVGHVDDAEKARYFASADLFVAPNVGGESFGIVLLEAMAAGLPVVASDIPGFRTVMRDGHQGRFVRPGDAPGLAGTILTLLSNDKLRDAMSREGRRHAAGYDWSGVAAQLEALYASLV
ncbi:MAG TPA: glycosyltransferase family 4 protein [Euzebyales bacterium]|nr:glycosyltransferase family 4 protein [Euzebyales bacterium]